MITSPLTSISLLTLTSSPFLNTLDILAVISLSAAIAFSALLSWKTPKTAFIITTAMIIITSANDSFSSTPDPAAATIRIMIMGSASSFRKRTTSGTGFSSFSLLGPSFSKRFFASSFVSPSFEEPRFSTTSFALQRYSFNDFTSSNILFLTS